MAAASADIHPEDSREARPREDFRAEAAASPAEEAHADSNISHIKLSEQGLILFGSFYFPCFCFSALPQGNKAIKLKERS